MQGFVVGLAGELGINIAQVFVRSGVAWVGAYRHFQGRACFVILALARIQHGEVVVGLRQLWIVFCQARKGANGFRGLAAVALDDALDEAHLRVFGLGCKVLVRFSQCFRQLACAHQLGYVRIFVSKSVACEHGRNEGQQAKGLEYSGTGVLHKAFAVLRVEKGAHGGAIYCAGLYLRGNKLAPRIQNKIYPYQFDIGRRFCQG